MILGGNDGVEIAIQLLQVELVRARLEGHRNLRMNRRVRRLHGFEQNLIGAFRTGPQRRFFL